MTSDVAISLMWPAEAETRITQRGDSVLGEDLNLTRLVRALSLNPTYEPHVRGTLLTLTSDTEVIAYRQAILGDLLRSPNMLDRLQSILDEIISLEGYLTAPQWGKKNLLRQVAWRLSELERYVETVLALDDILTEAGDLIQSEGLQTLREALQRVVRSDLFKQLQTELPRLLPQIRNIRSITVGINLDPDLRPESATLLEASTDAYAGEAMMFRLFGRKKRDDEIEGIGPLHDARKIPGIDRSRVELNDRNSPFMPQLFRDLSELLDETSRPIADALRKYVQINSRLLIALKTDIAFYIGAARLIQKLEAVGLPLCQPEIAPTDERVTHLEALYNVNLALQHLYDKSKTPADIVRNDALFADSGRIFILTGPNQGGKTTYTRAIGLAHVLFQAGLHVPAVNARMSPVDGIYTHFAKEERPNLEAGRLGEEARRLNMIFQKATRHSLVLLNESLASTAATESLYLARDVVRAFRLLGVRAVFATHLLDLAADAERLTQETEGHSAIISVVSQVQLQDNGSGEYVRRTYKIIPAPPMNKSYAVELAARYGISYTQITDLLKSRDVL